VCLGLYASDCFCYQAVGLFWHSLKGSAVLCGFNDDDDDEHDERNVHLYGYVSQTQSTQSWVGSLGVMGSKLWNED